MHLPTTTLLPTLLLLLNPVSSHPAPAPAPSPQDPYLPPHLDCPGGPTCQGGMLMGCSNGVLFCGAGSIISIPIGKCSDCKGSPCATSPEDYPGDSTPKSASRTAETMEKRDSQLVERQVFGSSCMAGYDCACVSFDGKGYYTKGKGGQCEAGIESCLSPNGWVVSACIPGGALRHSVHHWTDR